MKPNKARVGSVPRSSGFKTAPRSKGNYKPNAGRGIPNRNADFTKGIPPKVNLRNPNEVPLKAERDYPTGQRPVHQGAKS